MKMVEVLSNLLALVNSTVYVEELKLGYVGQWRLDTFSLCFGSTKWQEKYMLRKYFSGFCVKVERRKSLLCTF